MTHHFWDSIDQILPYGLGTPGVGGPLWPEDQGPPPWAESARHGPASSPDDPAPEPPTPADDKVAPCPVCGGSGRSYAANTMVHCVGECGMSFDALTWNRLARAAALRRACERLDAAIVRYDGDASGSLVLDDGFISRQWSVDVAYGPLADAIIALAARVSEEDADAKAGR